MWAGHKPSGLGPACLPFHNTAPAPPAGPPPPPPPPPPARNCTEMRPPCSLALQELSNGLRTLWKAGMDHEERLDDFDVFREETVAKVHKLESEMISLKLVTNLSQELARPSGEDVAMADAVPPESAHFSEEVSGQMGGGIEFLDVGPLLEQQQRKPTAAELAHYEVDKLAEYLEREFFSTPASHTYKTIREGLKEDVLKNEITLSTWKKKVGGCAAIATVGLLR